MAPAIDVIDMSKSPVKSNVAHASASPPKRGDSVNLKKLK